MINRMPEPRYLTHYINKMSTKCEEGNTPLPDKVVDQSEYKYSNTYIAVHIEKSHVQFTEIIRFDKNVFIEQKSGGNYNANSIKN